MKSYTLLVGYINLACELPFEIIPGYFLDRADSDQVKMIKKLTQGLNEPYRTILHECSFTHNDDTVQHDDLAPENWRYWVINSRENAHPTLDYLQRAFNISDINVILNPRVQSGTTMVIPPLLYTYYGNSARVTRNGQPTQVGESDLLEIRQLYERIRNLGEQWSSIQHAIFDLQELNWVSDDSTLKFLGYFSIIESVLTHKPDPKDPTDSLTRQIVNKLLLLRNRPHISINFKSFVTDDNMKEDNIIKRLYSLRSDIVHGVKPDFHKSWKCFKDYSNVLDFIEHLTKEVLKSALEEPQLISDLKQC